MNNIRSSAQNGAAAATRMALIEAGLRLFGEKGFDATSTREIASAASANIGSIAYHFGGKEGLRDACAEHIVERVREVAAPMMAAMPDAAQLSPEQAEALLLGMIERMVGFLVAQPEAGLIAQFILRELQHPTKALDIVYGGVFEPVHSHVCRLWAAATGGDPESERTRIAVFTMIGQIVYFRIARAAVMRRMDWAEIGPEEARRIAAVAAANLRAAIAAERGAKR